VFASAQAMAAAGHEVYLVSEAITAGRSRELLSAGSATWVRVEDGRPDHAYFTDGQGYADRVYDTLRRLRRARPLDLIEFPDRGGEGLTVLRARRLLGEFAGTRIVLRPAAGAVAGPDTDGGPWPECGAGAGPGAGAEPGAGGEAGVGGKPENGAGPGAGGGPPASLLTMITAAAERYCRAHAGDAVTGPAGPGPALVQPAGGPLVSVLIPVFNQGRYLADALASVRRSAYPRLEVVVVDDGSTDPETVAAVDALAGAPGVTAVRQRNAGLPAARNAGLARCTGRYVVPLDADDLLPPAFIGTAVAAMARQPRLGYLTGYVRCFGLLDHVQVPVGPVPGLSLLLNTYARATGLFCRDALLDVGGWDADLPGYEDWDLYLRLDAAGHESDVLPVDGHLYRRHPDSMTLRAGAGVRLEWLQRLVGKHAGALTGDQVVPLLQAAVQLWKTGYEPSASARLLAGLPRGQLPQAGEA
jgi:hypothetical protein